MKDFDSVKSTQPQNNKDSHSCTSQCLHNLCGDALILEGIEECDDGNLSSQDACLSDCTTASCGDGYVQEGIEECDDGNDVDGDGCETECKRTLKEIITGSYHTCALLQNGMLRCWGTGDSGRLGYGDTMTIGDDEPPSLKGDVPIGYAVRQLAAGGAYTCALLDFGKVQCWGKGSSGQLGYGNTNNIGDDELPSSKGHVSIGGTVLQLTVGSAHTCALLDSNKVRCWGDAYYGQLGYGNKNNIGDDELPSSKSDVSIGNSVAQITAGDRHTCALLNSGKVRCWGDGSFGRLGYGNTATIGDDEFPFSTGDVPVGETVVQIAAGYVHTCARLNSGNVRCWGSGSYGQLGYGNTATIGDNEFPSSTGNVPVGETVVQIAAGAYHTCARLNSGNVRCWGWNEYGQLGYGNPNNVGDDELPSSKGDVSLGETVLQISAGYYHSCALLDSGQVRCWGRNNYGQLGYGNTENIGDDELPNSVAPVSLF